MPWIYKHLTSYLCSILHVAVVNENVHLVNQLCDSLRNRFGSSGIDSFNNLGQTPLFLAVLLGNENIIKTLVEYGSSLQFSDRNGNTVFHLAVIYGHTLNCLLGFIQPSQTKILNKLNNDGLTPLHIACLGKSKDAIKSLVHAGADIDSRDGLSGRSPLMYCIKNEALDEDLCRLLLRLKADPWQTDYSGSKPMDFLENNSSDTPMFNKFI